LEKVCRILKGVRVHIEAVVIRLYHNSGHFYEIVGNGCDLVLIGTITIGHTIFFCIAGCFVIMLVAFSVATAGTALQTSNFSGELKILQEISNVQEEHAARQYDCKTFHIQYKNNKFLSMNV
jgi:hypothetical protein